MLSPPYHHASNPGLKSMIRENRASNGDCIKLASGLVCALVIALFCART